LATYKLICLDYNATLKQQFELTRIGSVSSLKVCQFSI